MIIKNTKLVIATVALILAVGAIAFAAGVGRGTPTLVVDHASDVLGSSSTTSAEPTTTPRPQRTTFTTSYPEAKKHADRPKRVTQDRPTPQATRTTSTPKAAEPTKAPTSASSQTPAPSPAPSPSKTPTPLGWLLGQLTSGF